MSKKLLAAAIAAALAPAAVMAEASNVTIYGRIDYGFMSRGGDSGNLNTQAGNSGRLNDFEDGIGGTNRLGFKGSEDLGNGLKAIYEFEFGFNGDTGSSFGATTNRHSWVGLTGAFGTALGGRVDGARYSFVGKYDPFKNQTVANAGSLFGVTSGLGQADRADNAIVYITPELAPGLKFLGAYTTSLLGESGANALGVALGSTDIEAGDTPLYAIAAMYDNGPLSLLLDYENLQIKRVAGVGDLEFDLWVAGASYDFGVVKLSAYYESTEGDDAASKTVSNGDGWLIGLSAPVTSNITLKASYVKANDDRAADSDCSKWGFGGEYAFSKRTTAYATYAKINNDDNAICAISKNAAGNGVYTGSATSSAVGTGGRSTNAAYGDSGFNIGIAHTF
jgi:predicted porin